jgi:2-amino-4-hydroxy-6-hydroxymethyldihydropteridine diphosphokinase
MTRVYLSIGSNRDRERHVRDAVAALGARFAPLTVSGVYETPAVGFEGAPFYNLAVGFDTELGLEALLAILRGIERRAGRVRGDKRFAPRTLDIDVLTFGAHRAAVPVELPRGEILEQAYVLVPLAEIAPAEPHPVLGETYAALVERLRLDTRGMRRVPLVLPAAEPAA